MGTSQLTEQQRADVAQSVYESMLALRKGFGPDGLWPNYVASKARAKAARAAVPIVDSINVEAKNAAGQVSALRKRIDGDKDGKGGLAEQLTAARAAGNTDAVLSILNEIDEVEADIATVNGVISSQTKAARDERSLSKRTAEDHFDTMTQLASRASLATYIAMGPSAFTA